MWCNTYKPEDVGHYLRFQPVAPQDVFDCRLSESVQVRSGKPKIGRSIWHYTNDESVISGTPGGNR